MKPIAVLDSSVVVAGIGWLGGDPRFILQLLARRRFVSVRNAPLAVEWEKTVSRLSKSPRWQNPNWAAWIEWLIDASVPVEEIPLKPTVKRDAKDDPVLSAAVSGRAGFLVSYDKDLLNLQKPYGVQCTRPRRFIEAVLKSRS